MTDTLRSISVTHRHAPNLRFQIGVHTPHQLKGDEVAEPVVVIEVHARTSNGVSEMVGSYKLDSFIEFARDIVSTAKTVVPVKQDVEASV